MSTAEIISIGLLALLILSELGDASAAPFGHRLRHGFGIWALPLLMVFAYIVIYRIHEIITYR